MKNNPLLSTFSSPFEAAPFDLIETKHYKEAFEIALKSAKQEISDIKQSSQSRTFENTIVALSNSGKLLDRISSVFFNLNSAETNDEMQQIAQEISPLLAAFSNDIYLDPQLYEAIKTAADNTNKDTLSKEQKMLLSKTLRAFEKNGATLNDDKKKELRNIDQQLSQLSLQFGQNVLQETNAFSLFVENKSDVEGIPENVLSHAKSLAEKEDKKGWVFTLQYPSYVPFMSYCPNRQLRKTMSEAFGSRCFKDNEQNNTTIISKIVEFRRLRAQLLGKESHAHFVLEDRMAKDPNTVFDFLEKLTNAAKGAATEEVTNLKQYASDQGLKDSFESYDLAFYKERLKKEKFDLDEELLKPYFELSSTIEGVFQIANKLFDITFEERKDIPLYHKDVKTYEVKDGNGEYLALFYADFFPRKGKRPGAWMTSFKGQWTENGVNSRPHISIVCNFSPASENNPSLLSFQEVTTLFHEFGHALHGILAQGTYSSLTGTNVYWDFVELPSQLLENWCYEEKALSLFAKHYKTGETIPLDLIKKIKKSQQFFEAYQTMRQLSFATLDMKWHTKDIQSESTISEFENTILSDYNFFENNPATCMSTAFSHIFQGGYSAGYYSYKWAEVLDADAFEYFKEKGIFNTEVAQLFKNKVLEKGGTEHPMDLYKAFRGREAKVDALLKRAGIYN